MAALSEAAVREARVEAALAGLDLTQRVGQLNQRLLGWRAVERRNRHWQLTDEGRREIGRWSGLGAIYGLMRADGWSGRSWANGVTPDDRVEVVALVQAAVRDANPCGIGALVVEEAPHGHQGLGGTILPQNLAVAATWNPELYERACAAVASELASSGVDLALVSGLDILRDPRWGRCEETFGEDPLLSSALVRAAVHGMQGRSGERLARDGVGVVLKHLAAQGEAVGGRNGQSATIGERDLREIHLPPVEAGIKAGALGMMAAYNDIDGVPCCANRWLLQTWLRDEQGFDGIVVADGMAVDQLLPLTGSVTDAGKRALLAGVDMSLWDEGFTTLAESARRSEEVDAAVTRAARRVLRVKDRLGLLPTMPQIGEECERIALRGDLGSALKRTTRLSSELAAQCLVPLKGHLPTARLTSPGVDVVVIGPNADDLDCFLGDYVAPLRPGERTTVLDRLRSGIDGKIRLALSVEDGFEGAVSSADVVIAVLGGTSRRSYGDEFDVNGAAIATQASCGEGADLADTHLPGGQDELIRRVGGLARGHVCSVVVAGRPHVLKEVLDASDSALWAGYAGPHGPAAVVAALRGLTVPTGRLPFTVPSSPTVVPVRYNDRWSPTDTYRDLAEPVLLPFGHGSESHWSATLSDSGDTVELVVRIPDGTAAIVPVFVRQSGGDARPRLRKLVDLARIDRGGDHRFVLPRDVILPAGSGFRSAEVLVGDQTIGTIADG
ncbi:beta-glucosidase [Tessaracoccus bendigoensis DSM 12906]|uniref:Beta-glucosidase n=1 Tax=Tessaracoccus bendigoensis DSM 12906 TaxID=1123357 RepID=A0A1M6A466_9ACTN|nr:glycoside hydrolase family 3 protein [Tessaracoccus bendigoensis]SHI31302.1 beta-glucosidase [Tessaracoccus bendigoensis DSM 12906]